MLLANTDTSQPGLPAGNAPQADSSLVTTDPPASVDEAVDTIVSSLLDMWQDFLLRLPLIAAALVVLLLTWVASRLISYLVNRSLRRAKLRRSLKDLARQVVVLSVWVIGLIIAAVVVFPGMTPAKVLTVLGLGSIAVGFAFKDIVENFFAGVLILWRFPFEPGDFIECGEIRGEVEKTTIRMTTIRQVDGQLVVLPNGQLFKTPVNVLTSQPRRRAMAICGVAYDTDLEHAQRVIRAAVEGCESVDAGRAVDVFTHQFNSSSIDLEVTWWAGSTPYQMRESRDEALRAIKRALDAEGISIPFPHRTLLMKDPSGDPIDPLALSHREQSDAERSHSA